jgi:tetratricopeptide (TPR) repeat protein
MQSDLERALDHGRRAQSAWDERDILGMLSVAITFGPIPVAEALRKLDALQGAGSAFREAILVPGKGVLLAMEGRIEEARRVVADAREEAEDLGKSVWAASVRMASATAEHIIGDLGRAELELRAAREVFVRLNEKSLLSSVSGHLANILCDLGRFEEALPFVEESRMLCPSTDVDCQIGWRCALALVLGQRGDAAEADRLAGEAVAMCRQTDNLNQQADTLCVLADVERAAGRRDEGDMALREAIALYERKGNVVSAATSRARLDELSA